MLLITVRRVAIFERKIMWESEHFYWQHGKLGSIGLEPSGGRFYGVRESYTVVVKGSHNLG